MIQPNPVRTRSSPHTVSKGDRTTNPTSDTAWGTQSNLSHHSKKEIKASVRQVHLGDPAYVKMLQAAPTARRLGVRLTPAPKPLGDPSIAFQPSSDEGEDMKDHIIRNMCSSLETSTSWIISTDGRLTMLVRRASFDQDILQFDAISFSDGDKKFMNDCMWAVFYLSEEGDTRERILVNHQIHRTQTIIETAHARPQDLTNVAAEFSAISFGKIGKQNPGIIFLDSSVGNNAIPLQAWATRLSEVWDPTTFMDKYDITGRPNSTGTCFQATQRSESWDKFKHSWDPRNRVISRNRGDRIREAIQVRSLMSLWTWTRTSMVLHVLEQTKRSMGSPGK